MTTRISKIARLPHQIREQLNHRIQHGQMGRTIVPWLNDLPETKEAMTEYFDSRPITHQNLSEWRRTGYQDWLQHQDRLLWFERLSDQETELEEHNHSGDGFETMGSFFLYEIGQALTTLKHIKNPHQKCDRLETLSREFARLQNAFNWSRRVQLEFDKHNVNHPAVEIMCPKPREIETAGGGASASARTVLASPAQIETDTREVLKSEDNQSHPPAPSSFCILPSALPNANPSPISDLTSPIPNPQTSSTFQPMPIPAPPTPLTQQFTPRFLEEINKIRKTRHLHPPQRGRRFICIEG